MLMVFLLVWNHGNNDIRTISTVLGYIRKIFWSVFMKSVMFNFACQFDYNWNQYKPKHLDTSGKDFLHWSFRVRRPSLNLGHTFPVQPT